MTDQAKPSTRTIDWEAIEGHYRVGVRSVRDIAGEYGITHGAINKRAARDGWERDLAAKIKAKADALVSKSAVSSLVSTATEKQIVDANAHNQASIQLSHRVDIQRKRTLTMKMLDELESVTDSKDLFEQLGELLQAPDEKGQDKRAELYRRVIDMPSRVDSLKKLVETFKTLVALERQAFGIKDEAADTPTDGIRKLLKEIDGSTASLLPD